jgi:glycosyltransferase involved in cell wall biosynthesis
MRVVRNELSLEGQPLVLALGRLSKEKGHADLLTAIALLRKRRPDLRFYVLILGEGPEASALASQSSRLSLRDVVMLAGFKSNPGPYYEIASIMALPSHSEGSPNVVLEAMCAGIPVLATNVGGVGEIIEDNKTGLLVPHKCPEDFAQALERLLVDAGLRERLGLEGRRHVCANFSPQVYSENLSKLYQSVLSSRSFKHQM